MPQFMYLLKWLNNPSIHSTLFNYSWSSPQCTGNYGNKPNASSSPLYESSTMGLKFLQKFGFYCPKKPLQLFMACNWRLLFNCFPMTPPGLPCKVLKKPRGLRARVGALPCTTENQKEDSMIWAIYREFVSNFRHFL